MGHQGSRRRFKEMLYTDYYDNYLMTYVRMFEHPRYSQKQRMKYNEILLSWHENSQFAYMEDYKYDPLSHLKE